MSRSRWSGKTEQTCSVILKAHLGLLLWALLVGLSFPAVGLIGADLPPMLLTALRFAVAAMALWGLARRAPDRWPLGAAWLLYGLMGSCLAGFFAAMFWAAHYATALSMATLFVSVPLLAFLFGLAAGLERRGWRLPLILAMGAAGALLLALAEAGSQRTVQAPRSCSGVARRCFCLGAWPVRSIRYCPNGGLLEVGCRLRRRCGPSGV